MEKFLLNLDNIKKHVDIERQLSSYGFTHVGAEKMSAIINAPNLYCRSLSFSEVENLFENGKKISVENSNNHTNMCRISYGDGIRTAMQEGFSKDINQGIKVVIIFDIINNSEESSFKIFGLPEDSSLYETKPETARVSMIGHGNLDTTNIHALVVRFHKSSFNKEDQEEFFDENQNFVTMYYLKKRPCINK